MMNGSRVNPEAPCDFFQDFDIIYFVHEVAPFRRSLDYIKHFGELMILQLPDDMSDPPPDSEGDSYCYLMQFADGNRIDLTFYPIDKIAAMEEDSLTLVLLDKDGILPAYPLPSNRTYLPKPPTRKQFDDCCNEFWWVCPYAAKGLWRGELTYARYMLDTFVREQLMKMLSWYVGVKTDFQKSPGKEGKYLQRYLEPHYWSMLEMTYADAYPENCWRALLVMGSLFRHVANAVGAHFGYSYPAGDDERVTAHLKHVRALPRDADTMY
jgi:aminoglycoside 6-adenylyltransferase